MKPDQSIIPDWGSIRRTGARIGSVVWKRNAETWLRPVRVDPGHDHPSEDQRPQRHQQELDEVDEECPRHVAESTSPSAEP